MKLGPPAKGTPTLVCVSALAGVPAWVRETCGDRVLHEANRAAGLDIERIEDQDCFIPHLTMMAFVDTIARKAGIPNLGLALAPYLHFESYGVWSDYVLGAPTLGAALRRAERSFGYHSYGDRLTFSWAGEVARFAYFSAARGLPGYRHDAAGTIGVMLSWCRRYLGCDWRPIRIELDLPMPSDASTYEATFQCPVLFDMSSLAVVFEAAALEQRFHCASTVPIVTIEDLARARLEPASRDNLLGAVSAQIRSQVLSGQVSLDRAAWALDTSVRTLQRELNGAGKGFRDLVNEIRIGRAAELLCDGRLAVEEVSSQLGYSSSAHFARAFRREAGLSPMEFRGRYQQTLPERMPR